MNSWFLKTNDFLAYELVIKNEQEVSKIIGMVGEIKALLYDCKFLTKKG